MKNILYITAPEEVEQVRANRVTAMENVEMTSLKRVSEIDQPRTVILDQSLIDQESPQGIEQLLAHLQGIAAPCYLLVDKISSREILKLSTKPLFFNGLITPEAIEQYPQLMEIRSESNDAVDIRMKAGLVAQWAMAAVEILQAADGSQPPIMSIVHGRPRPEDDALAARMLLKGEVEGQSVLVFSRSQATKLAAQLACCSEDEVGQEDLMEAAMEIVNQVSSQARTNCWEEGPQFEIGCPVEFDLGEFDQATDDWLSIMIELFGQPCTISVAVKIAQREAELI